MGGVGKLRLCGGNFRPRRDQNPSRNPYNALFWAYAGAGRHGRNCLIGDVLADAGKITVGVTAGASCPNNLIEDTIRRLFELRGISVQELLKK